MPAFLATVATIVLHTPIWVWPLYALLLLLGFQRTRDGTLPLWRVMILPTVVVVLAIFSFITAGLGGVPAMLLGLVIGVAAGWWLKGDGDSRRVPGGMLWLRGEWWSLALIVLVLIFRYAINVAPVLNPWLYADPTWHFSTLFVSALLSGLFLGRTMARLRVYFPGRPLAAS